VRPGDGRGPIGDHRDPMSAIDRDAALPDEVRSAFDYMPATLAGNVAGVGVVSLLFARATPLAVFAPWLLAFLAMMSARGLMAVRFARATPRSLDEWRRWRVLWNAGTLVSGALWGATAWVFYGRGDGNAQIALVITVYTFCVAAVPVLATQPRVFLAFAALCFVPLISRVALDGTRQSWELAGILLLIFTLTSALARNYRQALERAIGLKLESDRLAAQLREEKQASEAARLAADEARKVAEVANRAKTQFFAAASHDLRQPLHALGLFAEALRQRRHDDSTMQLVASINASVDALEGLFSELLDLTRIDNGGVDVRPEHFSVGELFRRLALHHEPVAFEKGLALRFRGHGHFGHADPLLVERILRNLLANAIRYTDDGGVLVSCRRRGERLRLEVWDTGPGIAPQDQPRIFDEFVQLAPTAVPGPRERKGLGLGLAIVRRLSALIDAPVRLRSVPGRGSVFGFDLPVGRPPRGGSAPAAALAGTALSLRGRRLVVVEDDAAVRGALDVLLRGWEAEVELHDSAAGALAALTPDRAAPDLLIVDYRLEGVRNGLEVIEAWRERFGRSLPVIVVTGSTMSELESQAHAGRFHLLVKPVVPQRLRALIGFKLGGRGA
jgi:signal transduction histidine kinase